MRSTPAEIVRIMREASGLGMADCRTALETARTRLGGDYLLALLARHANGFAISVKSPGADISANDARFQWDLAWAISSRDDYAAKSDPWRLLDAISVRYEPGDHAMPKSVSIAFYEPSTETIRSCPENYGLAQISGIDAAVPKEQTALKLAGAFRLYSAAKAMIEAFGSNVPDWLQAEFAELETAVFKADGREPVIPHRG